MESNKSFPCIACGKCCWNIGNNTEAAYLDRGDGTCRHLDELSNSCKIYEHRPIFCRVEHYYDVYLREKLPWSEYVRINLEICKKL